MKSYFLFAYQVGAITRATTFFKIAVGRSATDQRILSQVRKKFENCSDAIFAVYCSDWAAFLLRVADSLGYDSFCHFAAALVRHVDAASFVDVLNSRAATSLLPRRRRRSSANPLTL